MMLNWAVLVGLFRDLLSKFSFRLRKSQENLSGPFGEEGTGSSSSNMLRSKSIGNLRFSAAAPLNSHRLHADVDAAGTYSSPGVSARLVETSFLNFFELNVHLLN